MQFNELIDRIAVLLPRLLGALPVALAIAVGAFLLNIVIGRSLLILARRTNLTEADVQPIRRLLRWIVRLVACILILSVFGFEIGGVWGMLSTILGLVAIGFVAVWSLISNTTATVIILLTRPFQIGDDLEFPGEPVRGRVIDLNFFFTTLMDHEGKLFQIPNNLFFQKSLKRTRNSQVISLAAQLNATTPSRVEPPPAPPPQTESSTGTRPPMPLPQMNFPDTTEKR